MRKWWLFSGLIILIALVGGLFYYNQSKQKADDEMNEKVTNSPVSIQIITKKGIIEVELRPDLMPKTVANFLKLVDQKFYDGLVFHRVEDWVVQGGDPNGNGSGGPGWQIKLETNPELKNLRGAIAMARAADPNSAGSQFYILKKDASWLDGQYAVFGKVTKGMELIDSLQAGDEMEIKQK